MSMTEREEQVYLQGQRAVYLEMLRTAIRGLGEQGPDPDADANRWRIVRAEIVAMLRQVCEEHGDNDWDDSLHPADVIEKHLWRHLG